MITTVLAMIGVTTLAVVFGMWVVTYESRACSCGRWTLDEDSGVCLPLLDQDMLHDRYLCQPWQEYTTGDGPR